jgi:hypothetical protein
MNDFWPQFSSTEGSRAAPARILREQAALLREKTGGLVEAKVITWEERDALHAELILTVPNGRGYQYNFLHIQYPPEYYPLTLLAGDESYRANDEEHYLGILKDVLSSARTKRIVEAIMAHFGSETPAT